MRPLLITAILVTAMTASSTASADEPAWDDQGVRRFTLEATAGGLFALSNLGLEDGLALGGSPMMGVGFRYRKRYSSRAPADKMGWVAVLLAAPTMGLIFVPSMAWLGTDRGLDLRLRALALHANDERRWTYTVGLAPVFRVARRGSRWRFPAIIHFITPEIGVALTHEEPTALYIQNFRFPVSVLLHEHLGLELEPATWILIPCVRDSEPSFAFTVSLSMIMR